MNYRDSFIAAVSECECLAVANGHTQGRWQKVTPALYASMCVVCSELTCVSQQEEGEKHWLIGGSVLTLKCLEDDVRTASGD